MTPKILCRRLRSDRDERLRRKNALIDEVMDRYVEWREECQTVYDSYARWTNPATDETDLPFAAYSAALDREQSAATVYGHALKAPRAIAMTRPPTTVWRRTERC